MKSLFCDFGVMNIEGGSGRGFAQLGSGGGAIFGK